MAIGSRILSLFTISTLAVLICSLQSTPANALSIEHLPRSLHHRGHHALARRKRSTKKRCKPRSSSSSSSTADSSSTPAPTSSQGNPQPASSSSASTNSNNPGNTNPKTLPGAGGKLALSWANGPSDIDKWIQNKPTKPFYYTWSPKCLSNVEADCCPMLWGWNMVDSFQQTVKNKHPKCAMGMNEPEIASQSNIDVKDGINMWNQYLRPLGKEGTTLYSPAPTSDPAGKRWLQNFFDGCGGDDMCGVDVLTVHWYATSADDFIAYLQDMYDTFIKGKGNKIKGVFVSEFACQSFTDAPQCNKDQVWSFMKAVTGFMLATDWVLYYAPFGAMHDMQGVNPDNQLMNPDGSPNDLARAYGY